MTLHISIESGKKFIFATAVEWPGWSRRGNDEEATLQALLDSAPRLAAIMDAAGIPFEIPVGLGELQVVERLPGNASTDFGAPAMPLTRDNDPADEADLHHFEALLKAYWQGFDQAVAQAQTPLRKGPRGGGRTLAAIQEHVLEADISYLRRIAGKFKREGPLALDIARSREVILAALKTAVIAGLPEKGPRGGQIWTPRYFVRRTAWHVVDHTWEIEDRGT